MGGDTSNPNQITQHLYMRGDTLNPNQTTQHPHMGEGGGGTLRTQIKRPNIHIWGETLQAPRYQTK